MGSDRRRLVLWRQSDHRRCRREKLNNIGLGITLGYQINDNINLTFGYKSTINDDDPSDLRMDMFMVSFVFGWHQLIEGSKRLQSEK